MASKRRLSIAHLGKGKMWNHATKAHRFKRKIEVWDGERTRTSAHWTQPCVSSYRVRRCLWKSVQMACLSTTKRELPIQSSCAIIYSISLLFLKWWTQTSARLRPVVDRSRTKSTYPIETICFYTQFLVSKFHFPLAEVEWSPGISAILPSRLWACILYFSCLWRTGPMIDHGKQETNQWYKLGNWE